MPIVTLFVDFSKRTLSIRTDSGQTFTLRGQSKKRTTHYLNISKTGQYEVEMSEHDWDYLARRNFRPSSRMNASSAYVEPVPAG